MKTPTALTLAALLTGCAAHEPPQLEPEVSPQLSLARSLGFEPPDCVAGARPAGARTLWIGLDAIRLVGALSDSRVLQTLEGGKHRREDHLIDGMIEELSRDESEPKPPFELFVDRRVPMITVVDALYTLGRFGVTSFALGCGPVDRASALDISPPRFGDHVENPPTITAIRSDLALRWDQTGLRAWALPRAAELRPFAEIYEEEPPPVEEGAPTPPTPARPKLPRLVPLVLAEGADPPLSADDVARLASAMCRFNDDASFGVQLLPDGSTPFAELMAVATAAKSRCAGPRQLSYDRSTEPRTGAMTVEKLRDLPR